MREQRLRLLLFYFKRSLILNVLDNEAPSVGLEVCAGWMASLSLDYPTEAHCKGYASRFV